MKQKLNYTIISSESILYRVGRFVWLVEGNTVSLTKDGHKLIQSINLFTYSDFDSADDAAYKMALKQARY